MLVPLSRAKAQDWSGYTVLRRTETVSLTFATLMWCRLRLSFFICDMQVNPVLLHCYLESETLHAAQRSNFQELLTDALPFWSTSLTEWGLCVTHCLSPITAWPRSSPRFIRQRPDHYLLYKSIVWSSFLIHTLPAVFGTWTKSAFQVPEHLVLI